MESNDQDLALQLITEKLSDAQCREVLKVITSLAVGGKPIMSELVVFAALNVIGELSNDDTGDSIDEWLHELAQLFVDAAESD